MRHYTPDRWVVLEISTATETINKVFAGWYGGYTGSDNWQLNSGIEKVISDDAGFDFVGYSGSTYSCNRHDHGMSGLQYRVLESWLTQIAEQDRGTNIRVLTLEEVDKL